MVPTCANLSDAHSTFNPHDTLNTFSTVSYYCTECFGAAPGNLFAASAAAWRRSQGCFGRRSIPSLLVHFGSVEGVTKLLLILHIYPKRALYGVWTWSPRLKEAEGLIFCTGTVTAVVLLSSAGPSQAKINPRFIQRIYQPPPAASVEGEHSQGKPEWGEWLVGRRWNSYYN